jgi:hypothetical protein
MLSTIYVRLLGEGSEAFRPVPATKISDSVYVIDPAAPYDQDDETWEFLPGSKVVVEEIRDFTGILRLIAVAASR